MRTFNHVGIVTTEHKEGAFFNEGLSVWLTDYSKSPNRIELNSKKAVVCPNWYKSKVTLPTQYPLWKKS